MLKSISATDNKRRSLQDNISRFATNGLPAQPDVKEVQTQKPADKIIKKAVKTAIGKMQAA
jgi:hypothetical protein